MENLKTIQFKVDGIEMDINISMEDQTAWLSKEEIGKLYGRSRTAISRHITNLLNSSCEVDSVCAKNARVCAKIARTGPDGKQYMVDHYNLDIVLRVGARIKSNRGIILKQFVEEYFRQNAFDNRQNIIIYNNGDIQIDVNVSPEEDTVWLNVNQIATLFEVSRNTIYFHINKILEEGELGFSVTEDSSTTRSVSQKYWNTQKEIFQTAADGKSYLITVYNLDMILAIGYRVKSKRAIEFRRWASNVLKQYLMKGYAINENKISFQLDDYVKLVNRVEAIENKLTDIEKNVLEERIENQIFFENKKFTAREFITKLFSSAKEDIVLIDPYADILSLSYLKYKKREVHVMLITSFRSKLNKQDIKAFRSENGPIVVKYDDKIHDRYIVIDHTDYYHLGASLNYLGRKFSQITLQQDPDIVDILRNRIEKYRSS